MSDIENFLNDTPDHSFLVTMSRSIVNRIDKATDKVIEKLYAECLKGHVKIKTQQQQGDMNLIASRMLGVRNINELRRDINKNPLIKGSITNMLESSSIAMRVIHP